MQVRKTLGDNWDVELNDNWYTVSKLQMGAGAWKINKQGVSYRRIKTTGALGKKLIAAVEAKIAKTT